MCVQTVIIEIVSIIIIMLPNLLDTFPYTASDRKVNMILADKRGKEKKNWIEVERRKSGKETEKERERND